MNTGNYYHTLRMALWASVCWLTFSTKGLSRNYVFDAKTINVEDGLSNNNIYAVYEDDDQTLRLTGDQGSMVFDKNTETARVYLPRYGILHEEFNTFSHVQYKDGTLCFDGLAGPATFHPKTLRQEEATLSPPLYITKVSVLKHNAKSFIDKTAEYRETQKISLNPKDSILELELVLLDDEKSAENQYTYKLAGKQEQWRYTRENKITIMDPSYRRYQLRIPVYVPLPFYMQLWFIAGIRFTVVAGAIIAVRWWVQKLKKIVNALRRRFKKEPYR